jgi:cytochrome c553
MKAVKLKALVCAVSAAVAAAAAGTALAQSANASWMAEQLLAEQALKEQWPLLETYCMECHSYDEYRGGIALEGLSPDAVQANPALFEQVLRKLKIRAMPPRSQPQPAPQDRAQLIAALESTLDAAAAASPYAGTTSIHRLNRAEYANAIRDLLGVDVDLAELLPSDGGDYGFDNIAELLRTSPMLLDRYLTVGLRVADLALGNQDASLSVTSYTIPFDTSQHKHLAGLPLGTRGGVATTHYFPADGEYVFSARPLQGVAEGYFGIEGHDRPHEFLVYLDREIVYSGEVGGSEQHRISVEQGFNDVMGLVDEQLTSPRIPVKAGPHEVIFTWRERLAAEQNSWQPSARNSLEIHNPSGMPRLEKAMIEGPHDPSGVSEMAPRQQILVCRPEAAADEAACAREILSKLAQRAFRRPVTDADIEAPLAFYEDERQRGGAFDEGIRLAVARVLVSPFFLFRIETDAQDAAPGADHAIDGIALASRLSFFLWSSAPDDELLALAASGKLDDPAVRESQARRMLSDERADAFVENFVGQWLQLRNLEMRARPDLLLFPDFDDNLRKAFRRESELLFAHVLRENRPVHELLTADYTFADERLARHYGIDGVLGARFRKVPVADPNRRGLLGHGSVLALTSATSRTSPIMRGKFILSEFWNNPPPAAPATVPALEASAPQDRPSTIREQLERHRADPACSACHDVIDPVGFALENFDVDGAWRDSTREGLAIDASGILLDGTPVDSPQALRAALLKDPELFAGTVTEKLLVYALGRGLDPLDMPVVRSIVRNAARYDYSLFAIVLGIVESYPFLMRTNSSASSINAVARTED